MLGAITGMNLRPSRCVKVASAAAKFPEEDSTTVLSSQISPRSAARLRIQRAGRSLMLPTGFAYSSLAKRFIPSTARRTCRVGRRVLRGCSGRDTGLHAGSGFRRIPGRVTRGVRTVADEYMLEFDSRRKPGQKEGWPGQLRAP